MNKKTSIFLVDTALLLDRWEIANGNSIRFSKHDLSSSGGQAIQTSGFDQVCIFCHTPHNSSGYSRLIKFNTSAASPNGGVISYTVGAPPRCTLICHSHPHSG